MPFERILVPVDGSHRSEAVLRPVSTLAEAFSSAVMLLHVVERYVDHDDREVQAEALSREESALALASEYLEGLATALRQRGLAVSTHVLAGRAAPAILDSAQRLAASLIALTSRGRGLVPGVSLGSVAARVATASHIPVLVVKAHRQGRLWTAPRRFRSVLVPLDGSSVAEAALVHAEDLARRLQIPINLVTLLPAPAVVPLGENSVILWEAQSPAQRRLEKLASDYLEAQARRLQAKGLQVQWRVALGPAGSGVLHFAERDRPCLVVITSRGRSGPARWLGGVAEEVLRRCPMPVLMVPAAGADARSGSMGMSTSEGASVG